MKTDYNGKLKKQGTVYHFNVNDFRGHVFQRLNSVGRPMPITGSLTSSSCV